MMPPRVSTSRGVVAAPDPEDHAAVGEDVGGGVVLGQTQRMPHRTDVEAAADSQPLGHVREMHRHHQDVGDALVAFVLEVVLGEQSVSKPSRSMVLAIASVFENTVMRCSFG